MKITKRNFCEEKNMAEQFDLSPETKRVLEAKARRRLALREEFLKKASDPYRHASGEGGTVVS